MTIEILNSRDHYPELREPWNALVREKPGDLTGMDATSTYEWFETILEAFPEAAESRVLVARESDEVVGLLPVLVDRNRKLGIRLLAPTELYDGRNGFLVKENSAELLGNLLSELDAACPNWALLQIKLVAGSESERMLLATCEARGYSVERGDASETPYFRLPPDHDSLTSAIAKDLAKRIRSGERKLAKAGAVGFDEFTQEKDADHLLQCILEIERRSWKHQAGTAITNHPRQEHFYRTLFPRAMRSGLLVGHILRVDGMPVAYLLGLHHDGVYCDLKSSFCQEFEEFAVSHVNRFHTLLSLATSGIRTYDFMGGMESHKLRWSKETPTYLRYDWKIYNRNPVGRIAVLANKFKTSIRAAKSRISRQERPTETDTAVSKATFSGLER